MGQREQPRAALALRWSELSSRISGPASDKAGVRWEVAGSRLEVGVGADVVSITQSQWH